jgi:hypothetical protein
MEHIDQLKLRLTNERARLAKANDPLEIEIRKVWVANCEKELASEYDFLGIEQTPYVELNDDDLLAELGI